MTRSSCIDHPTKQILAVVRQDYYELTGDCVAAALLNIFEYWANAAIAFNPDVENPSVGVRTAKEFEQMLLGMATEKHIRKRLHQLEEMGFIETFQPAPHRKSFEYRFMVTTVQQAIDELKANGRLTVDSEKSQRSFDRSPNGRLTVDSEKSQRSFDRLTIYKKDLNTKKQEREENRTLEVEIIEVELEQEQVEVECDRTPSICKVDEVKDCRQSESSLMTYPAQPQNSGADKISAAPSAVAKFDQRFMAAYVPDETLGAYLQVWNQERPYSCGEVFKMDSKLRAQILEVSKSYSVQEFAEAVTYIREATEEFYRKEKFTLFRFTSTLQNHVGDCFTKHHNAMKTDNAYRDRVLGNAPSMDLGRSCPDLVGVPMAQQKYEQAVTEHNKPKSWLEQRAEERMRKYREESRSQESC